MKKTISVIEISPKHKQKLVRDFKVSHVTVQAALNDTTKSLLAKRIRKAAIELIKTEVKTVII